MFPYRRTGQKNRQANSQGGNPKKARDGGRRHQGAHRDVLSQLQPATKALAQCLAGNARPSGQLANARNVLSQAERFVSERGVERLPPREREGFLEQLALLKLTISDALDEENQIQEAPSASTAPPLDVERARALALSLTASAEDEARRREGELDEAMSEAREAAEAAAAAVTAPTPVSRRPSVSSASNASGKGERLRLKRPSEDAVAARIAR